MHQGEVRWGLPLLGSSLDLWPFQAFCTVELGGGMKASEMGGHLTAPASYDLEAELGCIPPCSATSMSSRFWCPAGPLQPAFTFWPSRISRSPSSLARSGSALKPTGSRSAARCLSWRHTPVQARIQQDPALGSLSQLSSLQVTLESPAEGPRVCVVPSALPPRFCFCW